MLSVKYLLLILIFFQFTKASEHGEPAASEHGGGAPAVEKEYSGKQSQQWSDVQTKLAALKAKVDAQENVVKALLKPAGHGGAGAEAPSGGHGGGAPAPGGSAEAHASSQIEQLKKEDAKLQALILEYNKINSEYETKFPEKGLKETRIYRRADPQSSEPVESGVGNYEAKLRQLQNKILRQYPDAAQKLKNPKKGQMQISEKRSGHNEKNSHEDGPKADDVTDQIILQK